MVRSKLLQFLFRWWQRLPASHYVLVAFLFFFGLELTFALQRWVLLSLLILFGLLTVGVLFIRFEESDDFHFTQVILPILAALGLTAFALFLPSSELLHLYFLAASLTFYFLLRFAARRAYPTWNWGLSALVLYVDVAAILGWHFHLSKSLFVTLLLAWLTIFLLAWQALRRIPGGREESLLLSLSIGLAAVELLWALQFSPLHFLIQAGIILIFYYTTFQILTHNSNKSLSRRHVIEYMMVALAALLVLLLTAQWI